MAKRLPGEAYALKILNCLMTFDGGGKPLTTTQLCRMVGCERKTVYTAIELLEVSGFGIEVSKTRNHGVPGPNQYRFTKIYGF